jgi:hypothetical protein
MNNFEHLIPELGQWHTDIDSWIEVVGRFDHAIAYGHIFWPEFKIHQECVLFADCRTESFVQWMKETGGDLTAVEGVLNHRHILNLFQSNEFKPTREVVLHLGRLLQDMWSSKLARDFPGRKIIVSFDEDFCEELVDYQITIFHKRDLDAHDCAKTNPSLGN